MKVILLVLIVSVNLLNAQFKDVPSLVNYATPRVVQVLTEEATGSGVIINQNGYILTNFHVVSDAFVRSTEIFVVTHDKSEISVRIIDYDDDLDLCLLYSNSNFALGALKIAHPDSLKVGEDVVCIGNPFGVSDFVTKGIISKYNTPYVFTSASINPGNSGGALLNMNGELVGITTMTLNDAQNFNIAICPRSILYFLKKNKIINK